MSLSERAERVELESSRTKGSPTPRTSPKRARSPSDHSKLSRSDQCR